MPDLSYPDREAFENDLALAERIRQDIPRLKGLALADIMYCIKTIDKEIWGSVADTLG